MAVVPFGFFSLIGVYGDVTGDVIIAPEYVLLQRPPSATVHDLSYLAIWSTERIAEVRRELESLARSGGAVVDSKTPDVRMILRAIEPSATPMFLRAGECRRTFARRQLKAALRRTDAALGGPALTC